MTCLFFPFQGTLFCLPTGSRMADGSTELLFEEVYIPSRILVTDVDGDGIDDIIVNANTSTWTSLVRSAQVFQSGTMLGLKWNGVGGFRSSGAPERLMAMWLIMTRVPIICH